LDRYAMIGIGGALGAIARYQLAAMIQSRIPAGFPWGTFVVNVSGCFAMGVVTTLLSERMVVHPNWRYLVPIGFIGAYTTFSTWMLESWRLVEDGAWQLAAINIVGSVALGLVAVVAGLAVGRALP
jgi:fluoride exporter